MSLDSLLFQFCIMFWFISKFILPLSPGEISGDTNTDFVLTHRESSSLTGKSAVCYPVHSSSARLFRAYFPAASLEVAFLLNSPESLAGNRRPKGAS